MENMKVGYLRYGKPGVRARCMFALANQYDIDFFYFSPQDVDIEKKNINGLYWDKNAKKYVVRETSYPDIIDDHFAFRRKDKDKYNELSKYCFMTYVPIGLKSTIYEKIENSIFARYLIETYHYIDVNINEMLNKYTKLIIKPNNGGRGNDIYKLSKENDDTCYLHYGDTGKTLTIEEFNVEYSDELKSRFIVQPYINSITTAGNPFDIRIHVRKGKKGKWTLVLIYPRIGSIKGVVSNVAKGGSTSNNIKGFLQSEFDDDWKRIYEELNHISKSLPDIMQSGSKKIIDSLGIDVGINRDNNNELKFFEVNTGPGVITYPFQTAEASIQYYIYLMELLKNKKLQTPT